MSTEFEKNIPEDAHDFKASEGEDDVFRQEWAAKFATQDTAVLKQSLRLLESEVNVPDSPDATMPAQARHQGEIEIELIKQELASRDEKKE